MSLAVTTPRPLLSPVPMPAAESGVVVRAQRGDSDARDVLARECQRQAFLLALQLTGNRDDALDVAQDALLRFFAALDRFDSRRPVRPWLLRIVSNLVRDRRRRARVRRLEPFERSEEGPILEPVDPTDDPETAVSRYQLQRVVWEVLGELPEIHREVLVLRDYQDLSYAEIAAVLGVARGTVMSRLHRARLQLSRLVRRRLGLAREVEDG